MRTWIVFIFLASTFIFHHTTFAGDEPKYCDPAKFDLTEINLEDTVGDWADNDIMLRIHGFKLGKVMLIGLGVGKTDVELTKRMALYWSPDSANNKYCTWYHNHASDPSEINQLEAEQAFIHRDIVKNPKKMTKQEAKLTFTNVLRSSFELNKESFINCAQNYNYIAIGCNSQEHRGPTAFGFLLAFSGCEPKHALEITNQIWGLNMVKRAVRKAAIEAGYELGKEMKTERKILQRAFGED